VGAQNWENITTHGATRLLRGETDAEKAVRVREPRVDAGEASLMDQVIRRSYSMYI